MARGADRKVQTIFKRPQKSYLERLYQDFPLDTIVGDGNFIFAAEHWRNLRGKKQILVPIRNIPGVPMLKEAEVFNKSISALRGEIERRFLVKHHFARLTSKIPYQFDWCTLVHVFAAACALENIALTIPRTNLNTITKFHFFERIETAEINSRRLMEIVACMNFVTISSRSIKSIPSKKQGTNKTKTIQR